MAAYSEGIKTLRTCLEVIHLTEGAGTLFVTTY